MKPDKLYSLISDSNQLDESTLVELQELIKQYPYFQTLRILWNYNLAKLQNVQTAEHLKKTATFAGDRSKLLGLFDKMMGSIQTDYSSSSVIGRPEKEGSMTSKSTDKSTGKSSSVKLSIAEKKKLAKEKKEKNNNNEVTKDNKGSKENRNSEKSVVDEKQSERQSKKDADKQNNIKSTSEKGSQKKDNEKKEDSPKNKTILASKSQSKKEDKEDSKGSKAILGSSPHKDRETEEQNKVASNSRDDKKSFDTNDKQVESKSSQKEKEKTLIISTKSSKEVVEEKHKEQATKNDKGQVHDDATEKLSVSSKENNGDEKLSEADAVTAAFLKVKNSNKKQEVKREEKPRVEENPKTVDRAKKENVRSTSQQKEEVQDSSSENKKTSSPPSYLGGSVQSRPIKEKKPLKNEEDTAIGNLNPLTAFIKDSNERPAYLKNYYATDGVSLVSFFSKERSERSEVLVAEVDEPTITQPLSEKDVETFIRQEVLKIKTDTVVIPENEIEYEDTYNEEEEKLVVNSDEKEISVEGPDHEKMIDALIGNLRKVRNNASTKNNEEDEIDRLLGETKFKKESTAYQEVLKDKPESVQVESGATVDDDLFEIEQGEIEQISPLDEVTQKPSNIQGSGSLIELAVDALEEMKRKHAEEDQKIDFEVERNEETVVVSEESIVAGSSPGVDSTIKKMDDNASSKGVGVIEGETVAERILRQVAEKREKLRKDKNNADGVKEQGTEKKNLSSTNSQRNERLLDKFIQEEPRIERRSPNQSLSDKEVVKVSVEENEDIVTESIAHLYIAQKYYAKAIAAYQKLSLKFPEKNTYFADQINEVKKLMNRE